MAALISMQEAKDHLRVPQDSHDNDADIDGKVDQATAIILQYLGVQTNTIETITAANPTVITTSTPHGLTSGTTYTISGTTTTPTVNGAQIVTVTGPTTFTVPVTVTGGQATAAGIVGTATYTDATVPGQTKASILLMLAHLYENRGDMTNRGNNQSADADLWLAIERLLMRSRDPALA